MDSTTTVRLLHIRQYGFIIKPIMIWFIYNGCTHTPSIQFKSNSSRISFARSWLLCHIRLLRRYRQLMKGTDKHTEYMRRKGGKNSATGNNNTKIPTCRSIFDAAQSNQVSMLWSVSSSIPSHRNSIPQCGQSKSPDSPSSSSTSKLQCGHWMTTMFLKRRLRRYNSWPVNMGSVIDG